MSYQSYYNQQEPLNQNSFNQSKSTKMEKPKKNEKASPKLEICCSLRFFCVATPLSAISFSYGLTKNNELFQTLISTKNRYQYSNRWYFSCRLSLYFNPTLSGRQRVARAHVTSLRHVMSLNHVHTRSTPLFYFNQPDRGPNIKFTTTPDSDVTCDDVKQLCLLCGCQGNSQPNLVWLSFSFASSWFSYHRSNSSDL